jgi:hypothetical protein
LLKNSQPMSEAFLNFQVDLAEAVAVLKDPRAASGLLIAMRSNGPSAVEGLADICPAVVDSIIAKAHEPEKYWMGAPLRGRAQAIALLGHCLRRPGANFSQDAASRIRHELMSAADDPDPGVRALAAFALTPLRAEPEVQAKLRTLAAADPYVSLADGTREGASRFSVREAAARALEPPDDLLFYVTRTPESRACSVQQASQPLSGQLFIGPYNRQLAHDNMCRHYDSTGHDPSLCWLVEPQNACGR